MASQIEADFEHARLKMGVAVDQALLQPVSIDFQPVSAPPTQSVALGDAYHRYMNDPTHSWSLRTREAYETSRKLAVSVIGADMPLNELSRVHLRDYIDVLRFLPKNAAKRYPKLTAREAASKARADGDADVMSAANANVCIANLSSFLNWAVNEELLDRNPVRGLRLADDVAKRDKRHPFAAEQLRKIFNAPLYTGCLDGERGYGIEGDKRPRNARFWVPLIGLHTGMRLNEICQLDVADIREVEGIQTTIVSVVDCGVIKDGGDSGFCNGIGIENFGLQRQSPWLIARLIFKLSEVTQGYGRPYPVVIFRTNESAKWWQISNAPTRIAGFGPWTALRRR